MTPPPDELEPVMRLLAGLTSQLTGREGLELRGHVERLAAILASDGPEAELRGQAAAAFAPVIGVVDRLAATPSGAGRAGELRQLAADLRRFSTFLASPPDPDAAADDTVAAPPMSDGGPGPRVPLDELALDRWLAVRIDELAFASAQRRGVTGPALRRTVDRTRRQLHGLVRQLEQRARDEASRARTASEAERLIDAVVHGGTPLGAALAVDRDALVAAFRSVGLVRMADGLRAFAAWLSDPADDPVAHVVALRARLADALGPATMGDPARSEAERRADFEREIAAAVDAILHGPMSA